MSLASLKENSLYILLFVRTDPHTPNSFHWAFYLHHSSSTGGMKYHIRNEGDGWMPGHGPVAAIFKEFLLVGLVRIADLPSGVDHQVVDGIMRSFDNEINTPGQTCRVWILQVLHLLKYPVPNVSCPSATVTPILQCDDLGALEAELMAWGNEHAQSAIANVQPRPVGVSSVSGCCSN